MKGFIAVICFTLVSLTVSAQVERIDIDASGNYELTVCVGNGEYIVVDQYGEVLFVDIEGGWTFYDDFWKYQAGKVKRVGDVGFSYYDDFWDYQAGKIKNAGAAGFSYNDNFCNYKAGKLEKAAGMAIEYHDGFDNAKSGKIKRLGSITVDYYSDWDCNANQKYKGLLKSINGSQYGYKVINRQSDPAGRGPMSRRKDTSIRRGYSAMSGSRLMRHPPHDPPKPAYTGFGLEGRKEFKAGKILVVVHDILY